MTAETSYYIGVDVGTGSARAALVSSQGDIVAESTYNTTTWRDDNDKDIFEQSSGQIWSCIASACRDVLRESKVDPGLVKGIGFDATCSLVAADIDSGKPITVTPNSWEGTPQAANDKGEFRDIILWADHRASKEAKLINNTKSKWLKYVGGTVSLEMEVPKMLWLKNHMPASTFSKCMFFDLPDWLTYRATGDLSRSNCSLACKCLYIPPGVEGSEGWNRSFFEEIGLGDFVKGDFAQVGGVPGKNGLVLTAGQPVGQGLSKQAAEELGLKEGTAVGSAVIDAYAGWIGTVAAPMDGQPSVDLDGSRHRLAAIAGTSTCHIVQSPEPVFAPTWGPYKHAVFPGYWMNEGGQSSTGQLLDFMVDTHPASERLKQMAKEQGTNHFALLTDILERMVKEKGAPFMSYLTRDMYLYPDLHGNRCPLADNEMRGMLIGMQLDKTVGDLALRYYATGEAIALQTRQIIDELNRCGHDIKSIFMSGGQGQLHEQIDVYPKTRPTDQAPDLQSRQEPFPHESHRRHLQHAGPAAILSLGLGGTRLRYARLRCGGGGFAFARSAPGQPRRGGKELLRHEGSLVGCDDPHVPTWNHRQAVCVRTGTQAPSGQVRHLPRVHRHPASVASQGPRRAWRVKKALEGTRDCCIEPRSVGFANSLRDGMYGR